MLNISPKMHHLMRKYTLVFVKREGEVLLGWKKKGFGAEKWNGFGGKVEPGETILEAAVRELREETTLEMNCANLNNIGHLEFTMEGEPKHMEVHVYTTTEYKGIPHETEEMRPKWFRIEDVPFTEMWPDDSYWFTHVVKEKPFVGKFRYKGFTEIVSYEMKEVESMEKFYAEQKNCAST